MGTSRHGTQLPADGIHVVTRGTFDTLALRDAATLLTADVGGVYQVGTAEPYSFWLLAGATPDVWVPLGVRATDTFVADTMSNPSGSDAITVIAPIAVDSADGELLNRLFDDTAEEAVTMRVWCPGGTVQARITCVWRALTGVAAKTLKSNAYGMTTDGNPGAWSAAKQLTDVAIVADQDWITVTTDVDIGDLNLTANKPGLVQVSRDATDAGDTLVGDAALQLVRLEWL